MAKDDRKYEVESPVLHGPASDVGMIPGPRGRMVYAYADTDEFREAQEVKPAGVPRANEEDKRDQDEYNRLIQEAQDQALEKALELGPKAKEAALAADEAQEPAEDEDGDTPPEHDPDQPESVPENVADAVEQPKPKRAKAGGDK